LQKREEHLKQLKTKAEVESSKVSEIVSEIAFIAQLSAGNSKLEQKQKSEDVEARRQVRADYCTLFVRFRFRLRLIRLSVKVF